MFNIFVQTLGYVGVLSFIISYAQKSRKGILFFSFFARIMFVTHYILLGAYAGALQNACGGVAAVASGLREKEKYDTPIIPIFIIIITAASGCLTYDKTLGFVSLLPAMGMLIQNTALWFKNQTYIRIFVLAGIPVWFIYNFTMGSIPAMICDSLSTASLVAAIVRYDIMPRIKNKKA